MDDFERSLEVAAMWHKELLDKVKILDRTGESRLVDKEPKKYFSQQTIDNVRRLFQVNNCTFVALPEVFTHDTEWDHYSVTWKNGELTNE